MSADWRERAKQQVRKDLYDAALDLFRKEGYDSVTVQRVTESAGVAKGTFFNHFRTKEAVVEEWYRRITRESMDEVEGQTFDSCAAAIRALPLTMCRRALREPALLDVKARIATSPAITAAEREQSAALHAYLVRWVDEGQRRGEFEPEMSAEFFAGVLVAVLTGTSREWVTSAHGFDLADCVVERVDFLLRAATSPKG